MTFGAGTAAERRVQRVSKLTDNQHLMLDFLLAEGTLADAVMRRMAVTLPEGTIHVVTKEHLLQMKRDAGRPQDLADIEKLEQIDEP